MRFPAPLHSSNHTHDFALIDVDHPDAVILKLGDEETTSSRIDSQMVYPALDIAEWDLYFEREWELVLRVHLRSWRRHPSTVNASRIGFMVSSWCESQPPSMGRTVRLSKAVNRVSAFVHRPIRPAVNRPSR